VFEYLPNGSLHDRLHECNPLDVLPWTRRVQIASNIACGLEYLHHEANPPIVHRDIKSQNILLTNKDFAKLADFGLSKAAPVDATSFQSIETVVKGSIGYLDPQYLITGVFSSKSDVYSFGVVLLELISGHPAVHMGNSLALWAAEFTTSPARHRHLVDERLEGKYDASELETLIELSRMCLQADGKMRPDMKQAVAFLNKHHLPSLVEGSSERMEGTELEAILPDLFYKMTHSLLSRDSCSSLSFNSYSGDSWR
jgi:serine/threonine-protein kinase PBS1